MKEYEQNVFGLVPSLAKNTRNKSVSIVFLPRHGNKATLSCFFPLFKLRITKSPKMSKQILADLLVITKKGL